MTPHQETADAYENLRAAMRLINAEIVKGEPRYAFVSRMGGPFQWEQVGGRVVPPLVNLQRVQAHVQQATRGMLWGL